MKEKSLFVETKGIFSILNLFASQHHYSKDNRYIRATQYKDSFVLVAGNNYEICSIELDRDIFTKLDKALKFGIGSQQKRRYLHITNNVLRNIKNACDSSDIDKLADILGHSIIKVDNEVLNHFNKLEEIVANSNRLGEGLNSCKKAYFVQNATTFNRVAKLNRTLNKNKEYVEVINQRSIYNNTELSIVKYQLSLSTMHINMYAYLDSNKTFF